MAKLRRKKPTGPAPHIAQAIKDFGTSQEEVAKRIFMSRLTVNELAGGKRAITPETALKLERLFGLATLSASMLLALQSAVDLDEARARLGSALTKIKPLEKPKRAR